jgi:lipid-A-disaccharide synthase
VFIGVDAPDFNLQLEADLRERGVKTIHFVCPSIWAWRAERVEKIRRSVDHVLCVFPFEPALLARHGIAATYVGHPLANLIPMQIDRAAARVKLGLSQTQRVVAVLPGSRESEIKHLSGCFFQAIAQIQKVQPETQFVVPAVPALKARIEAALLASGVGRGVLVLQGQSHTALAACDVTLIASGTATLEAALFKRPMVISYRKGWLDWKITQRKRLQPWVGLPNILCQEFVVPELLQDQATPQALATEVLRWLDILSQQPEKVLALEQRFSALHAELMRDTAGLAAQAVAEVLSR